LPTQYAPGPDTFPYVYPVVKPVFPLSKSPFVTKLAGVDAAAVA
jgi:hypothetical protein